ncbi:hypothetical protein I3I95_09780 [bacterium]|nr:hypothetical protein [bacterium]
MADLGTIDYKSGTCAQLDAAIRRHVVTQANQARNDLLVRRMDEAGCDLVFISSHWGCRPTHEWFQGRVFSRSGANAGKVVTDASGRRVTVGRLSDTGYGAVAGLCGADCGHVMYPFSPGDTELPDREFASQEREFGRTGAEQYALTQRQRALERKVRKAKREAAATREAGADDVPSRLALGRAQAELRAFCSGNRLTRMPGRERAYGVGAQLRALTAMIRANEYKVTDKGEKNRYTVNRRVVNGKSYPARFEAMPVTKRAARGLYEVTMRILEDRDGTDGERMVAVSWETGKVVADTFGAEAMSRRAGFTKSQAEKILSEKGGVAIIHNHPESLRPSFADIRTVAENRCIRASLVACHDGTVYCVTDVSPDVIVEFVEARKKIIREDPDTMDSDTIDSMATDVIYQANEVKKWFRMKAIGSPRKSG